jgi:hypothetical protein
LNIFGRSKEEVREILSRLKPKTLLESHVYPVGYYSASGKWRYRDRMLVKGTKVFVTPEGKPFLKEDCGNPIIVTLPYPIARAKPSRPPIRLPESLEAPPVKIVVKPVPSPEQIFPPEGIFTTPPLQTTPPISSFPPVELLAGDIDTPLLEVGPEGSPETLLTPRFPAAGDNPYWLALLLPLFFLNGGGGGHGPGPPGPVVPETSSWVLMLAAGLGVAAVTWRSRRSRGVE